MMRDSVFLMLLVYLISYLSSFYFCWKKGTEIIMYLKKKSCRVFRTVFAYKIFLYVKDAAADFVAKKRILKKKPRSDEFSKPHDSFHFCFSAL